MFVLCRQQDGLSALGVLEALQHHPAAFEAGTPKFREGESATCGDESVLAPVSPTSGRQMLGLDTYYR